MEKKVLNGLKNGSYGTVYGVDQDREKIIDQDMLVGIHY